MIKQETYNGSLIQIESTNLGTRIQLKATIDGQDFKQHLCTPAEILNCSAVPALLTDAKKKIDGAYFPPDIKTALIAQGFSEAS